MPFLYLAKFINGTCKLLLCRVFMTCISAFNTNKCIFFTTKSKIESIYWE
jgi:putative component of membrane protein insertase Oxa1/YidC/SpoIIIJ protein YidD